MASLWPLTARRSAAAACSTSTTAAAPVVLTTEMVRAQLLPDYQERFWQTRQGGSATLRQPILEYKPRPRLVQRAVGAGMIGALAHASYVDGVVVTSTTSTDGGTRHRQGEMTGRAATT